MPLIRVTNADLMKTKNLAPGWYGIEVVKTELKQAKSGESVNVGITFLVEKSGGKEITQVFNSLLLGKIAEPYKALTGQDLVESSFDTDIFVGKKCDGYIAQRQYEGNMFDEIQKFVPYGKGSAAENKAPF